MDPVDEEVREQQEEWELDVVVCASEEPKQGMFDVRDIVVDEAVPTDFSHEKWECEHGHDWHRGQSLFDLHFQLVLEVLRMLEGCLVEDEGVR